MITRRSFLHCAVGLVGGLCGWQTAQAKVFVYREHALTIEHPVVCWNLMQFSNFEQLMTWFLDEVYVLVRRCELDGRQFLGQHYIAKRFEDLRKGDQYFCVAPDGRPRYRLKDEPIFLQFCLSDPIKLDAEGKNYSINSRNLNCDVPLHRLESVLYPQEFLQLRNAQPDRLVDAYSTSCAVTCNEYTIQGNEYTIQGNV